MEGCGEGRGGRGGVGVLFGLKAHFLELEYVLYGNFVAAVGAL